jgi:hypothetical protein
VLRGAGAAARDGAALQGGDVPGPSLTLLGIRKFSWELTDQFPHILSLSLRLPLPLRKERCAKPPLPVSPWRACRAPSPCPSSERRGAAVQGGGAPPPTATATEAQASLRRRGIRELALRGRAGMAGTVARQAGTRPYCVGGQLGWRAGNVMCLYCVGGQFVWRAGDISTAFFKIRIHIRGRGRSSTAWAAISIL